MKSKMRTVFFLFCIYTTLSFKEVFSYKIPNAQLDILQNGFRVSIPDVPGIENVAFNINRNRRFKGFEQGEFSIQIREPVNDRWSYESNTILSDDDKIYLWTNVQYKKAIYRSKPSDPILVQYVKNDNTEEEYPFDIRHQEQDKNDHPNKDISDECKASITVVENRDVCKGQLIFEENFDSSLNSTKWKEEVRFALDNGDSEFNFYDVISDIHDGILHITPRLYVADSYKVENGFLDLGTRCTGTINHIQECKRKISGSWSNIIPPVISGRINTKNSFNFKYGKIEIRAKTPKGDWIVPLMLLEPTTNHYGQTPYHSGQMRIAFVRGNDNLVDSSGLKIGGTVLYGGTILTQQGSLRDKSLVSKEQNTHFGDDFHIYTLFWSDRGLTLQVDGEVYGQVEGNFAKSKHYSQLEISQAWEASKTNMAPLDQEFFITLGISIGGHGDFPDHITSNGQPKPWINTSPKATLNFCNNRNTWMSTWSSPGLEIDYVRVYAI